MKALLFSLILLGGLIPVISYAEDSEFDGRWELVPERSSSLDGWTSMNFILEVKGDQIDITYDMHWRSTHVVATNSVNTMKTVKVPNFFRVEQRHMAVYPKKDSISPVSAEWLDNGRTIKVIAMVPVEVSQGESTIRIDSEFRLGAGDDRLTVIELHSTRNNPLVYRFKKLPSGESLRP